MIFIVIPAYNEEGLIQSTIESIGHVFTGKKNYTIVIIDDGSTDKTVSKVKKLQKKYAIKLLQHKVNLGPGKAFLTGITHICAIAKNSDLIITIEADNTNDSKIIPTLIHLLQEKWDVVCVSRYLRNGGYQNFPLSRKIFSFGANYMLRFLFPIKGITDYTIFFRGYRAEILKKLISDNDGNIIEFSGFVGNAELLIKLSKMYAIRYTEVPTLYDYKNKVGKSNMKIINNLWEYYKFIRRYLRFR